MKVMTTIKISVTYPKQNPVRQEFFLVFLPLANIWQIICVNNATVCVMFNTGEHE